MVRKSVNVARSIVELAGLAVVLGGLGGLHSGNDRCFLRLYVSKSASLAVTFKFSETSTFRCFLKIRQVQHESFCDGVMV